MVMVVDVPDWLLTIGGDKNGRKSVARRSPTMIIRRFIRNFKPTYVSKLNHLQKNGI